MRLVRSLTISLAIVLTIIGPTNGFTIRHRSNASDLAVEESSVVEVKSEPDEINTPREDEPVTVIPIQRTTEPITLKDDASVTQEVRDATDRTLVDKVPTEGTESITTDEVVQTAGGISQKDWFETTVPLESETDKVENCSETSTSPVTELSTKDLDNIISAVELQTIMSSAHTPTEPSTTLMTTTEEEITVAEEKKNTQAETTTNIEPISTLSASTLTHPTDTTTTTDNIKLTETTETDTTPFWKKYTHIERIRVTKPDEEEKVETTPTERATDSVNAHTTETRVSLEQAFNLAPDILSLQQLKNDLIKTTNTIGYREGLDATNTIEALTESVPPSTDGTTKEVVTLAKATEEENQLEMVSKRAGYLDHSKTTVFNDASTVANVTHDGMIELDVVGYELDPDSFGTGNKTSQSQLAEDAMKEELLKESFINDKEETSMLYHTSIVNKNQLVDVSTLKSITQPIQKERTTEAKVTDDLSTVKITERLFETSDTDKVSQQTVELLAPKTTESLPQPKTTDNVIERLDSYTSTEQIISSTEQTFTTEYPGVDRVTEDLSVKPISPEKKVTPNLYTVNPNYKPLKKLDIQPPKSFTRDPDDNSWRNESLSSLGIVFKAKNSSKAFTEVLKNKTEIVMNNLPELNRTIEKIELRDRLEKIAEKRKSKKKKTDQFGLAEYNDYEETNNTSEQHTSKETPVEVEPLIPPTLPSSTETPTLPSSTVASTTSLITNPYTFVNTETEKPNKVFNLQEYYDTSEEDDYVTLPKVDIMKATSKPRVQWPVTQSMVENTNPTQLFPERKPTIQYFPPRAKTTTSTSNEYLPQAHSTGAMPQRFTESKSYPGRNIFEDENVNYPSNEDRNQPSTVQHVQYRPVDINKNVYLTQQPKQSTEGRQIPESYNRGFVIRHYKDLIDAAIKDNDYDRNVYPYTEQPTSRVTAIAEKTPVKSEEYDYDARKEVLDRFVDNFNQNHEQFKADFPVVFNTSIVHQHGPEGGKVLASSSAMFKRLYNDATATKANGFLFTNKPYDPNCENITVELSPAYELHYYVPDQEEREEQAVKVTLPYGYRI